METELEVIHLHQARDLIELGKFDAARPLLEQPVMKALETSRATLLKRLPDGASPACGFLIKKDFLAPRRQGAKKN